MFSCFVFNLISCLTNNICQGELILLHSSEAIRIYCSGLNTARAEVSHKDLKRKEAQKNERYFKPGVLSANKTCLALLQVQ